MKLKEALPFFRGNRQRIDAQSKELAKKQEQAKKMFEKTGEEKWNEKAATLELSLQKSNEAFQSNQEILDHLTKRYTMAWNEEANKALSDPETGMAATLSKIMTTVARMCAGDKVPYSDEKKLMEFDSDLYGKAKQAQMSMAMMKEKQKEYESLWDEEGGEYDPKQAADNTEVSIEIPESIQEEIQIPDDIS